MKFLKEATYIRYVIAQNQHADLHKFMLTEDSLKIKKRPRTSFQATFFIEFLDKKCSFVIFHKLVKFHCQNEFTSQVIQ